MKEIEIEKVYLIKNLPEDLNKYLPIQIRVGDFYNSNSVDALKIRQKGERYEVIKKEEITAYEREEHVIEIKKEEFNVMLKATVQQHRKVRYLYPLDNKHVCEIDIYKDKLDGYVRVEVEFRDEKDMNNFVAPDWFGEEITELNHDIHEDLGVVSFNEMVERFREKGIELKNIKIK